MIFEEPWGDARPAAAVGLGLVDARLVATKNYELAGAVTAGLATSLYSATIGSADPWRRRYRGKRGSQRMVLAFGRT